VSEPLDIVEVLRRPLETISQCRRMRYVTAEVAEIAAAEIARLRESLCSLLDRSSPPEVVLTAVSSHENAPGIAYLRRATLSLQSEKQDAKL
jgi:hypothetical protein